MKDCIKLIETQIQEKKHIFITGTRGSGKTTLINELRERFDSNGSIAGGIPGIITWCVPGEAVYMRRSGKDESVIIGKYDPHSLSAENSMKSISEGFNVYGISFLEELIHDKSEWVLIDEIGFLEGTCHPYLEKLDELFEQKRVMAVIRKQEIEHLNAILHREDALVIDLDYDKECLVCVQD